VEGVSTSASIKRQVGDDPEGKGLRHVEDFYRTGEIATRALMAVEKFPGTVWECACGTGDMSRVLETGSEILRVYSSDLVDRGYGIPGPDFLRCPAIIGIDHIITNPPYRYVDDFVAKALELAPPGKIAFIARLQWLEGQRRKKRFFDATPPSRVWVFPYRIPMTRGDLATPRIGLVAFAWYVWDRSHVGPPQLGWLPKP
jgi:hypothetical protein